jgi:hypothetical protein
LRAAKYPVNLYQFPVEVSKECLLADAVFYIKNAPKKHNINSKINSTRRLSTFEKLNINKKKQNTPSEGLKAKKLKKYNS